MANFLFEHPTTGEIKEIYQSVHDAHVYSEDGVVWDRVWTVPQAAIDTSIDCNSARDFTEKTGKKKGSLGDLWNCSAELSEKRAKSQGIDPVKQKHYDNYSKMTKGKIHPDIVAANKKKTFEIDLTKKKVNII